MKRILYSVMGGVGLLSVTGCSQDKAQVDHPNVIYIFPDQMRNHAMGFWKEDGFQEYVNFVADPVYTPHLNQFAKEAVVLTSAISNCPVSSPHRGMLLTGMYPQNSGVTLNCNSNRPVSNLRQDAICISDVYHQAGYNCAYFGKLHVDYPIPNDPENPGQYVEEKQPVWDAYTPVERRHHFDYWYSYGTFDVHKQPHYWDTQGKKHEIKEWSPQHEASQVIAYLKNEGNVRDPQKPFLIMLSMNPPHGPYSSLDDCMEEDYNLYKDQPIDSLLIRPNADKNMEKAKSAPYYFASVTGVDRQFGRILDALKTLGLDKNTIIVFSSDHGETMCSHGLEDPKNSPYAESVNVPFMIRFPEKLKPRVEKFLLSSPDIMPTLLGLSGLENMIPAEVEGRNYADLFSGKTTSLQPPTSALYLRNTDGEKNEEGKVISYFPAARGIKTDKYTLAFTIDKETLNIKDILLFDDLQDPYQQKNLDPAEHQETIKSLCAQLAVLLQNANDPWYTKKILSNFIPYQ